MKPAYIELDYYFVITLVLTIVISLIFYVIFVNVNTELDFANETLEDYALIISNIPHDITKEELEEQLFAGGVRPIDIIPAHKLQKYEAYKAEYNVIKRKLLTCKNNNQNVYKSCCTKSISVDELVEELKNVEINMQRIEEFSANHSCYTEDVFAGQVIAIFQSEGDANNFRDALSSKNPFKRIIDYFILSKKNKKDLDCYHIDNAYEPSDIKWENLEYSYGDQLKRTTILYIISIVLMVGAYFFLYFLTIEQKKFEGAFVKLLASIVYSLITNMLNYIICRVLFILTE